MVHMIYFVKLINSYKIWFIKINGRQLKYENRHHCDRVAIRLCISVLISSDFIPRKPICTSTQRELKKVSASLKKLAPESRHRVLSIGPITFKHRHFFFIQRRAPNVAGLQFIAARRHFILSHTSVDSS